MSARVSEDSPIDAPINILIVDDEPKNLTVLETVLDDPSYRLIRAESADQALLALVNEEFALLILDVQLPGMTGFELAKMVKDRKKTAQVPIIFLTAYFNADQHVLAGYDTGAVDYLHKPVNPVILRSKVAVFTELHRKSREVEMANHSLLAEVSERRRVEEQLRELNEHLEKRVAERTEALREADLRKNEFLAILAHELRNPLAPIRNAVQVLHMGPPAEEQQWATSLIDRQAQHMTRLVDELMDVSRITLGKIELKREHVELAHVVQIAVETSRPLIDEAGHTLTVAVPAPPVIVDVDTSRLSQVFLNLLNNAAKFTTPAGRIDLRVEQQGTDVVVSVKDTGIGIPTDKLATIFEMFTQVAGKLSRSHGGLGVGLSLVKRLVEMHGGSVEAHSDGPGQGSEFVIRLPIVAQQSEVRGSDSSGKTKPVSSFRVLVVDDNRDAAASLTILLKMMGNTVEVAYDGGEAVSAAQSFRPHVVLCDIGLPVLNGYEVCRRMREHAWDKRMIVIAVTGWGQDEDKAMSQEAGFDRHLVKPVDPSILMNLLAGLPKSWSRED